VSLNFENGDKGVEFKLADAVDDGKGGIVQLEYIISEKNDKRVQKLIIVNTPLHDFAILAIIFLSMSYLILLIP